MKIYVNGKLVNLVDEEKEGDDWLYRVKNKEGEIIAWHRLPHKYSSLIPGRRFSYRGKVFMVPIGNK